MNRKGFRKDMMRGLAVGLISLSLVSPVYDVNHNYGQGRDVISGSRVSAAMADAAVEVTSRPPVVEKLRDRTIFDLGNGRKKAEVYPNDVRFKDDKGEYQDYDTSLVKKNHEYTTANSDKMSHFPEKIDRESPITTENNEYSIDMFWGAKGKKTSSNMQIGQE
ncbi:MAG: hypothetical protein K6G63_04455, partial [Eubacterium sp.]|nr:hypothetical protein [Eubacterium sp.]